MVLISVTGIMILSFLIILCAPYKKKERKRQGKKRTKLWFVYGPAMFIVDRLPDKIVRNNQQVNRSIEKLTVKEDVEQERYIYMKMCIRDRRQGRHHCSGYRSRTVHKAVQKICFKI